MTYEKHYWEQSGNKRFRLNEIVIWAVNKLEETETHTTGIKIHLEGRLDQLITDIRVEGWRQASSRFRKSVDSWIATRQKERAFNEAEE